MAKKLLDALRNAVRREAAVDAPTAGSVTFNGSLDDFDVAGLVAVHRGPIGDIAVDAERGTVVVTNHAADCITVLNPNTLNVVGSVRLDGEPFAVAATGDHAYVSISSATHDAVVVVDTVTGAVLAEYPLAFSVTALTVSPDGKRVFAGRTGDDRIDIAVIDTTAERVGTIDIATGSGFSLDALRVDASGKRLFAATSDARGSRVITINAETAQVEGTVWVGAPVRDLALGCEGTAYALTSDRTDRGVVHIIDLAAGTVAGAVEVGGAPTQLVLSPDAIRAYIVDYDRVVVLCTMTNTILGSIDISTQPSAVVVREDGGRLYVADYTGHVNAFDVATVLPSLYSELAAAPVALPALPVLEPAGA